MMKLQVSHLKDGLYTDHLLDAAAAFGFENPDDFTEKVKVDVQIDKRDRDYYIKLNVKTQIELTCDRCLEQYSLAIDDNCSVLFTPNEKLITEDSEFVRLIADNPRELEIDTDVRETVLLGIPIKAICSESCKGLCQCGQNLNISACTCADEKIDPRWEALKKLKKI
ncbi:MAG: DUF177 domain-containing protein [Calditrichaeota bacterium]|nr:MAG: DUF177 domain-containing protein [Calditrichota bacterium]